MDPIASYREARLDGKRTYDLFADRIRIRGNIALKSEFDTVLPLHLLSSGVTRLRLRNPGFWAGVWLLLGSGILGALLSLLHSPDFLVAIPVCFGLGGVVLMLATVRKVEFASFSNKAGVRLLDLARSGPDAKHFEEFVQLLATHIAKAPPPSA